MKLNLSIILVCVTLLWGCSVPKQVQDPTMKALPDSFANGNVAKDTGTVLAEVPWKQFFPDEELRQLIDTAISNNPDLQMALQRIKITSAYMRTTKGALLPSISADATASGTRYGKYTQEGVGNFDTNLSNNIDDDEKVNESFTPNFWLGFNTSWEMDVWGKLNSRKKEAFAKYLASQEGRNAVQTALVSQVASLFYTIKGLDLEYKTLRENIALQDTALEKVKALMEGGRATQLAVQQFQAQLLNTQNSAVEVTRRRNEAENQINALVGRFGGTIQRDTISETWSTLVNMDSVKLGFPIQIIANRPDIREASFQLAASKANVDAARKAFFPSFTISGYAAFNAFKGALLFNGSSLAYSLLGGVSAPIFQKNRLKSEFSIATAEQQNAFFQYQKNILNGYQEVSTSLSNFEAAKEMYALKTNESNILEAGVQSANDLYIGGYAGYLEIIAAQKSLVQAQVEQIQLRRDILLSLVDIYRSIGGGWR